MSPTTTIRNITDKNLAKPVQELRDQSLDKVGQNSLTDDEKKALKSERDKGTPEKDSKVVTGASRISEFNLNADRVRTQAEKHLKEDGSLQAADGEKKYVAPAADAAPKSVKLENLAVEKTVQHIKGEDPTKPKNTYLINGSNNADDSITLSYDKDAEEAKRFVVKYSDSDVRRYAAPTDVVINAGKAKVTVDPSLSDRGIAINYKGADEATLEAQADGTYYRVADNKGKTQVVAGSTQDKDVFNRGFIRLDGNATVSNREGATVAGSTIQGSKGKDQTVDVAGTLNVVDLGGDAGDKTALDAKTTFTISSAPDVIKKQWGFNDDGTLKVPSEGDLKTSLSDNGVPSDSAGILDIIDGLLGPNVRASQFIYDDSTKAGSAKANIDTFLGNDRGGSGAAVDENTLNIFTDASDQALLITDTTGKPGKYTVALVDPNDPKKVYEQIADDVDAKAFSRMAIDAPDIERVYLPKALEKTPTFVETDRRLEKVVTDPVDLSVPTNALNAALPPANRKKTEDFFAAMLAPEATKATGTDGSADPDGTFLGLSSNIPMADGDVNRAWKVTKTPDGQVQVDIVKKNDPDKVIQSVGKYKLDDGAPIAIRSNLDTVFTSSDLGNNPVKNYGDNMTRKPL
jgi:hypothetical protein